jgi:hypothetical protein
VATNHQDEPEWPAFALAARSVERAERLAQLLVQAGGDVDAVVRGFLRAPLYHPSRDTGFLTLYTVVYRPVEGTVEYHWPGSTWAHSMHALGPGTHHALIPVPARPQVAAGDR